MVSQLEPQVVARDLGQPETPVLDNEGAWVIVEMRGDRSCVSAVDLGSGRANTLIKTGRPNGVAIDPDGNYWVADTDPPGLLVFTSALERKTVLTEAAGSPLLFPNDLVFGPDGFLYLTDSGILLEDWAPGGVLRSDWRQAQCSGRVIRVDPVSWETSCIDEGLQFVNGLTFDLDSNYLYVNEMLTGEIFRYERLSSGAFGPRESVVNVTMPDPEQGFRGPDGMAFSDDGRLWVAMFGQGDITVVDPEKGVVDRIRTLGAFPTNCSFGKVGDHILYVTEAEHGQIEAHDVGVGGATSY